MPGIGKPIMNKGLGVADRSPQIATAGQPRRNCARQHATGPAHRDGKARSREAPEGVACLNKYIDRFQAVAMASLDKNRLHPGGN
jgi:hypothetical protein